MSDSTGRVIAVLRHIALLVAAGAKGVVPYLALEQAAKRYEAWSERRNPGHVAATRQFMQQMRGQAASAAKA